MCPDQITGLLPSGLQPKASTSILPEEGLGELPGGEGTPGDRRPSQSSEVA